MSKLPLVVDLDGTLIFTDMLYESAIQFLKKKPWGLFSLFFKLLQGKASLKSFLAKNVAIQADILPYNQTLINYIKQQKKMGQKVILCTATHSKIAENIASYLNLFDEVIASDANKNIIGEKKADILNQTFGKGNYIYAGNSKEDIPVWKSAQQAILVNTPKTVAKKAKQQNNILLTMTPQNQSVKTWFKALRVHQWLKNILIFIPLIAAHQLQSLAALQHLLFAFFAFSFCASSVYITNDLLDLESDRRHPKKCKRPFAAGDLPITQGIFASIVLFISGLKMALYVNPSFLMILLIYYGLTTLYSFKLKRIALIDCLLLATLYTTRIIAGGVATDTPLTFWLLASAFFLFYSLALIKRFAELKLLRHKGMNKTQGRDYHLDDESLIHGLGIGSGLGAVIIFALYLNSPNVFELYRQPEIAWLTVPVLLFWISWMWQQTHRGQMDDDPLVFAIKHKTSLITGLLFTTLLALATKGLPW